jgi:GNAT superfamily N-acetyltransferase
MMESIMQEDRPFRVHAVISDGSKSFRSWNEYLETETPIMGSAARLKLKVEFVDDTQHLFGLISDLITRTHPTPMIALSETFATRNEDGKWQPTALAQKLRDLCIRNPTHLCGLIAVLNDQPHRISDIDAVLNANEVAPESLKRKLLQVAIRLWLKSPVSPLSNQAHQDAIRVHSVRSESELKECFKLRHRVYDALGYLEAPVSRAASRIDMDSFDTKAIHFAAVDHRTHEFVGTARLVTTVPQHIGRSIIGDPWRVIRDQAAWAKAIATHALLEEDRVFREKINQPVDLPFPILLNSGFGTKYNAFMDRLPPALGGEVSRVVVSPLHRGLGISALLMRAVISVAFHMKKEFLLLECVPAHASMYEKYGFRLIEGHHFRSQDLDQLAVGMSLSLEDHPFNKAVAFAKSDGRMLGDTGFVCLCRNTECWKQREFQFRHNEGRCPLMATYSAGNSLQSKAG